MLSTEDNSPYEDLENMPIADFLRAMNAEDQRVPLAVAQVIPQIEQFIKALVPRMKQGGRLFYIGAGTSGRLGIVDASECPPTFGVADNVVIGIIAGGDSAIRKAVEFAEDSIEQAWKDISVYQPTPLDTVVALAASGRTPYCIGGVQKAQQHGLLTACIVCNPNSPLPRLVDYPIVPQTGPEILRGSTRLKAGTAQKLVLNMISTTVMIQLGRVKGNKMVDMQLTNQKLIERGTRFLMEELFISEEEAKKLLSIYGSVRKALENYRKLTN
ncbi:MAG: N-acetylmuramic acid 6-phosphate etherase [Cytophagales bacterium]|nr:N-acetylmuramic acid 6-phosphate etherase [Cytophagales bacterium]MDW8384604.1 N-acetylmuramic acid 6-phosphate etherase [Flammeovirgaceae bacterium]